MEEKEIFNFDGGVGDILKVYEDRIVISHKGILNILAMGLKGEKTIYYYDLTSVQFKKPGFLSGYIQFSLNGGVENSKGLLSATQDENTITISSDNQKAIEAEKIYNYINQRIRETKNSNNNNKTESISNLDEIRKLKSLLDDGIITKEEFDAKKKELLGL